MNEPGNGESQPKEETDLSGLRVLVVEDMPVLLRIYEKYLKTWGIVNSRFASSPAEAEEIVKKLLQQGQAPNLVLTDFNMPGGNGLELLGELREAIPNLRAIVSTSMPLDELQTQNPKGLTFDYIDKGGLNMQMLKQKLGAAARDIRQPKASQ